MIENAKPYPTPTRRPVQYTVGFLLLLTTFCAFSTCAGRLVFRKIEARGDTGQEANAAFDATVSVMRVPESARNVDYLAYFQGGTASFDLPESEFLDWANSREWKLAEVNLSGATPSSWQLVGFSQDVPEDVRRAWHYSSMSHRGGWSVMYDRDRGRGYVEFAPR
jgi:hypothetical protein